MSCACPPTPSASGSSRLARRTGSGSSSWPKSGPTCRCWSRFVSLRPRASFGTTLSLAARSAKAGGACLGLALLVLSGDPAAILGLLAVVALAIGGVVWTAGARHAAWVRLLLVVSALVAARIAAGPAAAALGAVLLALGVLLRIRTEEVVLGL